MAFKDSGFKGTPKFKDTDEVEAKLQSKQQEKVKDTKIKKAVKEKHACVDIFEETTDNNE